ncbi:Protein lsm14 [Ameca splendens]|uniref:Protein lsm14 n=1 Tax=Ameca splendens TaxID=208324 RepID=A0ABV0Z6U8_9TELE
MAESIRRPGVCASSPIFSNKWSNNVFLFSCSDPDLLLFVCFRKAGDKSGASGFPRERRQTWADERRMNAETFGIPLRQGRGRGGYRGRGGLGFRGGRGRSSSRGSFGPPQGSSFRGGYRGNQAGREFANLPYRKDNKAAA